MDAETKERDTFEVTPLASIDYPLLVFPNQSEVGETSAAGWILSAREEDGFRVYQAMRGDRVYTTRIALSMKRHVAFNPATSRFEDLSQSVRVELRNTNALKRVVETVGGTSGKVYPLLGIALVHLPANVDPVRATQTIRELPEVVDAWVTVKGARREPR